MAFAFVQGKSASHAFVADGRLLYSTLDNFLFVVYERLDSTQNIVRREEAVFALGSTVNVVHAKAATCDALYNDMVMLPTALASLPGSTGIPPFVQAYVSELMPAFVKYLSERPIADTTVSVR